MTTLERGIARFEGWEYVVGKPKEQIEMSAKQSMDGRLAAERELFAIHHSSRVIKMALVGPSAGRKDIPVDERRRLLPHAKHKLPAAATALAHA